MCKKFVCVECGCDDNIKFVNNTPYCEDCFNKFYMECPSCGEIVGHDETTLVDGDYICHDCIDRYYVKCEHCDNLIEEDDAIRIHNGTYVCRDCYDEYYFTCNDCDEIYHQDYLTYTVNGSICPDCLDEYYSRCDHCEEYYPSEDMHHADNISLCDDCIEYYVRCYDCNDFVHVDNAEYDDDTEEYYCSYCYNRREVTKVTINGYSYKPSPRFYGEDPHDLFMGVELEIDGGGEDNKKAKTVLTVANTVDELWYAKHDGSLRNGFELVSHPASFEYWMEYDWWSLTKVCKDLGYRSHDTSTCGLHVHMSRNAFGEEDNIVKFIFLIEKFWYNMLKFSRRTQEQIGQWARRYCEIPDSIETIKRAIDIIDSRYMVVNLENSTTVEVRLFRGTLNPNTIKATLQLLYVMFHYVMSGESVLDITWDNFVRYYCLKYNELKQYLMERNLISEDILQEIKQEIA